MFRTTRYLPVIFVLVITLVSSLGAMGQVKVTLWHAIPVTAPGGMAFLEVIDEFMALHPEIDLEVSYTGSYGETAEKLIVALAGGVAPNIAMFSKVRNFSFYETGALLQLNELLERDGLIDDFFPQFLEAGSFGNEVYGLPYRTSTAIEFHNLTMYDERGLPREFPTTWDDFRSIAARLTHDRDGDGIPETHGTIFNNGTWDFFFDQWIYQNDGRIINDAGTRFVFDSPQAVGAVEFVQDLVLDGMAMLGPQKRNFIGDAAIGIRRQSTAQLGDWKAEAKFDLGVSVMSCNVRCWASISGGNFSLINTGTPKQQEAAWAVLKHLFAPENLAKYSIASGYMVTRESALHHPIVQEAVADDPRYMVPYMQVEYGEPRAGRLVPFWADVQTLINDTATPILNNGENAQNVLTSAVHVANSYLDQYFAERNLTSLYENMQ